MRLYKKVLENKFFLKILISYCLIIIAGLGFTSYFITSSMVKNLIDSESKYEKEILQKVAGYAEDKFKIINNIFTLLYIERYHSPNASASIIDLINPNKGIEIPDQEKRNNILTTMQNICDANSFITDMIVMDYAKKDVFFSSNGLNRDLSINYDFFSTDTFKTIRQGNNSMGIIPNYVPDYITGNSNSRNYPVITVFINLYDNNFIRADRKIGAIAININPEIFDDAYKNESRNMKGNVLIMNSSGYVYHDSKGELTGKKSPYEGYKEDSGPGSYVDKDLIINVVKSGTNDLVFMNVVKEDEIYKDVRVVQKRTLNIILLFIGMTVLISIFASQMFTRRIKRLVKHMRVIEKGDFDVQVAVGSEDEIGYLERSFNSMCKKIGEYIKTVYLSEIKTKTSELKALQAQINPHFMFNTLESIRVTALINEDKQAAKMIHILGNLFRWNIKMKDMIVDISDEMDYIRSYIELQKYRYNSFAFEMNVDEPVLKLGIPKLILQPVIENAIYHGIGSMAEHGKLAVEGRVAGDTVEIRVMDNGQGVDEDKLRDINQSLQVESSGDNDLYSIGLSNVQQRLNLLFGKAYGLKIASEAGKGTTVTITIPALSKQEMENDVQSNYR